MILVAIAASTQGKIFNGYFLNITYEERIGTFFSFQVRSIVYGKSSAVEEVRGQNAAEICSDDVKAIRVDSDSNQIQIIPRGLDKFFQNLVVIYWRFGQLVSVTVDDLQPFSKLEVLWLFSNKIVSIDGDLFKYSHKLRYISFANNSIEYVGRNLFTNLTELTNAYFHSNVCINKWAQTFEKVQELNRLLPIKCPPLDAKTANLFTAVTRQKIKINEQTEVVDELIRRLDRLEERIIELEKKMIEINIDSDS